jgi:hypothetical protein
VKEPMFNFSLIGVELRCYFAHPWVDASLRFMCGCVMGISAVGERQWISTTGCDQFTHPPLGSWPTMGSTNRAV